MRNNIIVNLDPPVPAAPHPCVRGDHRWAWLTGGGQACAVCGVRR